MRLEMSVPCKLHALQEIITGGVPQRTLCGEEVRLQGTDYRESPCFTSAGLPELALRSREHLIPDLEPKRGN